jgi:N-acyl-phosphatidylethanolamine-hydrolysing phospholipase D
VPRRFTNPWPEPRRGLREVLRWKLGRGEKVIPTFPDAKAPAAVTFLTTERLSPIPDHGWQVTWLGHAAFLLSGCGARLLVDPIFSDYCGPLPWLGFKRLAPPPCGIAELPPITAVLLTHTHYDHCDLPTLRRLGRTLPLIVPSGHRPWFRRQGFAEVTEIAWWESVRITTDIVVTATPARHFTARTPWDRNRGHWCGWHLAGGGVSLWHSGDSGYGPGFQDIGQRLGPVDFGMIAIGAYEPRWFMQPLHIAPAEAVLAFEETRCRQAIGMHWGTFRLSDEPLGEPPLLLAAALSERNLPPGCFTTGAVGQQWHVPPSGLHAGKLHQLGILE